MRIFFYKRVMICLRFAMTIRLFCNVGIHMKKILCALIGTVQIVCGCNECDVNHQDSVRKDSSIQQDVELNRILDDILCYAPVDLRAKIKDFFNSSEVSAEYCQRHCYDPALYIKLLKTAARKDAQGVLRESLLSLPENASLDDLYKSYSVVSDTKSLMASIKGNGIESSYVLSFAFYVLPLNRDLIECMHNFYGNSYILYYSSVNAHTLLGRDLFARLLYRFSIYKEDREAVIRDYDEACDLLEDKPWGNYLSTKLQEAKMRFMYNDEEVDNIFDYLLGVVS